MPNLTKVDLEIIGDTIIIIPKAKNGQQIGKDTTNYNYFKDSGSHWNRYVDDNWHAESITLLCDYPHLFEGVKISKKISPILEFTLSCENKDCLLSTLNLLEEKGVITTDEKYTLLNKINVIAADEKNPLSTSTPKEEPSANQRSSCRIS